MRKLQKNVKFRKLFYLKKQKKLQGKRVIQKFQINFEISKSPWLCAKKFFQTPKFKNCHFVDLKVILLI